MQQRFFITLSKNNKFLQHTWTAAEASLSSQLHEILDQNASIQYRYGVSDLEQQQQKAIEYFF